ncbi:MAG: SDR family oxidoreductase [Actinomycetota bacterium]|nr:SDR family oxidoreductase [Actinomycetota bacterium]
MLSTYRDDLFREQSIVVTGGTSGIGAAIASAFGALGASVMAAGLGETIMQHHERVQTVELDLTDTVATETFFAGLDTLDVLVNCAGIIRRDDEFDPDVFAKVLDVNLVGTMRACALAHPLLKVSRGSIINTASMHSFIAGPRVPAYSASKGGVAQLTKSLAGAYGLEGIRVNAVAPGWIQTPLTTSIQGTSAGERIRERTPMNRWGTAEEVAAAAVFLASPAAHFVTGTVLPVDGGFLTA